MLGHMSDEGVVSTSSVGFEMVAMLVAQILSGLLYEISPYFERPLLHIDVCPCPNSSYDLSRAPYHDLYVALHHRTLFVIIILFLDCITSHLLYLHICRSPLLGPASPSSALSYSYFHISSYTPLSY